MSERTPIHSAGRLWWRVLAYAAGGLATAMFVGALVIGLIFDTPSEYRLGDLTFSFSFVLIVWVGAVIVAARPGNRVGLLMVLGGIAAAAQPFFYEWALLALARPGLPGETLAAWLGSWLWFPAVVMMPMLLLIFPTGCPLPRWRWVMWFAVALAVVGMTAGTIPIWGLPTEVLTDPVSYVPEYFLLDSVVAPLMSLVLMPLALISLVVRYRRAGTLERSQIKWLAWAMGISLSLLVASNLSPALLQPLGLAATLSISLVPIAIAFAILRYRLYDIDRIVNRTLVYGALTVMLVAVYVGGVAGLQYLFRTLTGQEQQPQLVIVATTLLIAALFNPLRRRIQTFIDQRFYRRKYDAAKTLEEFNARLRDETDLETLSGDLLRVVRHTMQPEHASLWLRPGGTERETAAEERER